LETSTQALITGRKVSIYERKAVCGREKYTLTLLQSEMEVSKWERF
jgi:hypothetical protein